MCACEWRTSGVRVPSQHCRRLVREVSSSVQRQTVAGRQLSALPKRHGQRVPQYDRLLLLTMHAELRFCGFSCVAPTKHAFYGLSSSSFVFSVSASTFVSVFKHGTCCLYKLTFNSPVVLFMNRLVQSACFSDVQSPSES